MHVLNIRVNKPSRVPQEICQAEITVHVSPIK